MLGKGQKVGRSLADEVLDENGVGAVDLAQLLEVLLDVSLAAKDGVQTGVRVGRLAEERGLVELEGPLGGVAGSVVRLDGDELLRGDAGQRSSEGVDIVALQEDAFEFGQQDGREGAEGRSIVGIV